MSVNDLRVSFEKKGYVILPKFLDSTESNVFLQCAEHLFDREEKPGNPMKYFESSLNSGQEILNRVENFVDEYEPLKEIVYGKKINDLLVSLSGKPQFLFKDKINYKLPGGGGFAVHQDAPAFTLFTREELLVVMIPVDLAGSQNGCMQVADNYFDKSFIPHINGKVPEEKLADIQWRNIEVELGDVFVFSSFLIHRSHDNLSSQKRRCFYLTYNISTDGDLRKKYFDYKRQNFPPRIERTAAMDLSAWKERLAKTIL